MRLQEIPALAGLKVRTNQGHPICSPDFAFVITYAIPSKCPVYVELPVKLKWTIRLKFAYIFIWFLEFLFQKVLKHCKWQQLWLITRVRSMFFHALVDLVYNAKKKLFLMSTRPWWKAWLRRTFRPLFWINPFTHSLYKDTSVSEPLGIGNNFFCNFARGSNIVFQWQLHSSWIAPACMQTKHFQYFCQPYNS